MSWFGPRIELPPLEPLPMFTSTATTYSGTVTFLGDGSVIVGCPVGTTDYERVEIAAQVTTWNTSGRKAALVLPWAVDVTDLRPWMQPGDDA